MEGERFAINATTVGQGLSGLNTVSVQYARALLKLAGDRALVYTPLRQLKEQAGDQVRLAAPWIAADRRFRGHAARLLWSQTALPLSLKREGIRTVFCPVDEGSLCGGLRQIVTFYDILPLIYPEIYPRRIYYNRHYLPRLIRAADTLVFGSENTHKDMARHYALNDKPCRVIYPGLDHGRFKPDPDDIPKREYGLDRYFLYVGEMRPYKNLERAIKAFSALDLPGHRFVIVGSKDRKFYPQIARLARELGLEQRMVFTGYLPEAHLPAFYTQADALVFASLYEGFGLPPLEAMACGCPVIASREASLPEACGDAAFYVEARSVEGIGRAMRRLALEEPLRRDFSQKGLERAAGFSWENSARQVLVVIDEVQGRSG